MEKYFNEMKKLCNPAFIYFWISLVSVLIVGFQNLGNTDTYCIGLYECDVENTLMVFILKIMYIIFWTFILNLLCNSVFKELSWFLVILPYILFFVIIGLFVFNNNPRQSN